MEPELELEQKLEPEQEQVLELEQGLEQELELELELELEREPIAAPQALTERAVYISAADMLLVLQHLLRKELKQHFYAPY